MMKSVIFLHGFVLDRVYKEVFPYTKWLCVKRRNAVKNSEWALIIPAVISVIAIIFVVIGWFVSSRLNWKNEIAKRSLDHRMETLKNYISFYIEAQKTKSLDGFNDIQVSFHLYGDDDEIELIEKITHLIITQPKNPEWLKLMKDLNILIRNKLRTELEL